LSSGEHWRYGIANVDLAALACALAAAGGAPSLAGPAWATAYAQARLGLRRDRLKRPFVKLVLLPFVLALLAFRRHQHIAYGSTFGECCTFGSGACLEGFALW
jgi:apolipoprotein N-acyltransferase